MSNIRDVISCHSSREFRSKTSQRFFNANHENPTSAHGKKAVISYKCHCGGGPLRFPWATPQEYYVKEENPYTGEMTAKEIKASAWAMKNSWLFRVYEGSYYAVMLDYNKPL